MLVGTCPGYASLALTASARTIVPHDWFPSLTCPSEKCKWKTDDQPAAKRKCPQRRAHQILITGSGIVPEQRPC